MPIQRRSLWVYAAVAAGWAVVLIWQMMEHLRVREAARLALMHRGRDITSTCALVIRSQRRWGGFVAKERLESALAELIKSDELNSIALLNQEGEIVASAGESLPAESAQRASSGVIWTESTVTLANLVDLDTSLPQPEEPNRQTIVVPSSTFTPPPGPQQPPQPSSSAPPDGLRQPRPPQERPPRSPRGEDLARPADPGEPRGGEGPQRERGTGFNRFRGRSPFVRPPWMNEEEYRSLIAKKGVHSFMIVLSTATMRNAFAQDLWMRLVIGLLATASGAGAILVWRNIQRTAELELRLVKASEMNSHLKKMNLAAAGLAHETRNPLNIIRGLAQLVARDSTAAPEARERSSAIVNEADRVTAQLNEFINYSRPREVRPAPVPVVHVANEVARALAFDLEEKKITLTTPREEVVIEADEQLFRQTLFNLLLNAIQAGNPEGHITVSVRRENSSAAIEVADDGPGVPAEKRQEIFKPYFTTNQNGTGLGLAVVQQIVAAHGWSIQCLENQPRGAVFRIDHIKLQGKGG